MVRRYEVTDEQWKIIEPHLGNKAKRTGRPKPITVNYLMACYGY